MAAKITSLDLGQCFRSSPNAKVHALTLAAILATIWDSFYWYKSNQNPNCLHQLFICIRMIPRLRSWSKSRILLSLSIDRLWKRRESSCSAGGNVWGKRMELMSVIANKRWAMYFWELLYRWKHRKDSKYWYQWEISSTSDSEHVHKT